MIDKDRFFGGEVGSFSLSPTDWSVCLFFSVLRLSFSPLAPRWTSIEAGGGVHTIPYHTIPICASSPFQHGPSLARQAQLNSAQRTTASTNTNKHNKAPSYRERAAGSDTEFSFCSSNMQNKKSWFPLVVLWAARRTGEVSPTFTRG
jgi:hypothetical protein